jgi:hypothetical protein
MHHLLLAVTLIAGLSLHLDAQEFRIVLCAGAVTPVDKTGHYDYLGGVQVLHDCLMQTPGVQVSVVRQGWPEDDQEFQSAHAVVFYCDGGGKQDYLATPARIATIQAMITRGAGLVVLHQAIDHPGEQLDRALGWLGGAYDKASSTRGHWPTTHSEFPVHPLTQGVTPWTINDGWLTNLRFVPGMTGIIPCVWAAKVQPGSKGLPSDQTIAAWGYERPTGGRSFTFTGLDGHDAWKFAGVRQLVTNGVLWSAGATIPSSGAPCVLDDATIDRYLTPRVDGRKLFKK